MARSVSVPFEEVLKQLEEEFDAVEREYQGIDEIQDDSDSERESTSPNGGDFQSFSAEEECNHRDDDPLISFENSSDDFEENAIVERFIAETCWCQLGPQQTACSVQLSRKTMELTRNNCHQMTRQQLYLVILSQLNALRTNKEEVPSSYQGDPSKFRPYTMFYMHGMKI